MRRKKSDKNYIYNRDNGTCHFCGKKLLFKQISLDHYLPRSKGGPDDIFNLVLSCKKCNKMKKSHVPEDYENVMINLLKRAVEDEKIISAGVRIKKEELKDMINDVNKIEHIGEYTVFQSKTHRFYIKHNKVYKIVKVDTKHKDEEWWII